MTSQQIKGHIYQSICFVGYEDRWLPDSFFTSLLAYVRTSPSSSVLKANVSLIALGGGAIALKDDGSRTCITSAMRNARYYAVIEAYWRPGSGFVGKEEARDWAHGIYRVLAQYKCTEMTHAADEVSSSIPLATTSDYVDLATEQRIGKLILLKSKYDPQNFFSENANIIPKSPTHPT